jgi:hypothetical protein
MGKLKVEDRSSKDTSHGVTETIVFGNTGARDTYIVAIQVRDKANSVITAYREATGRVQPGLQVSINPGNPLKVAIELTKEEASRAHWIAWQSENGKWKRIRWNAELHYVNVHLDETVDHSAEVDVKMVHATGSGGSGSGSPDARELGPFPSPREHKANKP